MSGQGREGQVAEGIGRSLVDRSIGGGHVNSVNLMMKLAQRFATG